MGFGDVPFGRRAVARPPRGSTMPPVRFTRACGCHHLGRQQGRTDFLAVFDGPNHQQCRQSPSGCNCRSQIRSIFPCDGLEGYDNQDLGATYTLHQSCNHRDTGVFSKTAQHADWASRSSECDRPVRRHYRLSISGRRGQDLEHFTGRLLEVSSGASFHCLCIF